MSEATTLLELQELDFAILRDQKKLEELPQRAQILDVRAKLAQVGQKSQQVQSLRQECNQSIQLLQDESESLAAKMASEQSKIDAAKDYKEVNALSKEIESLAKRLEKVEFDTLKAMERSDKIAQVEAQVTVAQSKLAHQEEEHVASFRQEGGALQQEIGQLRALRDKLASGIAPELLKRYERAAKARDGVGAVTLEGDHCSGCRVEFSSGQLAKLRQAPEITECPYCHRLLVVGQ